MTEMFGNMKAPKPLGPRYAIDPVAFFKALFLAPLMVAGLGFWALGIPVIAVPFGGPLYLLVGTPVLLIYLQRREGTAGDMFMLGFAAVAIPIFVSVLLAWAGEAAGRPDFINLEIVMFFGGFGLVFGPLWGAAFGVLYNRWRSPASRRPVPPFLNLPA